MAGRGGGALAVLSTYGWQGHSRRAAASWPARPGPAGLVKRAGARRTGTAGILVPSRQRPAVNRLQDRGGELLVARAGAVPPVVEDSLGPPGKWLRFLAHFPILALSGAAVPAAGCPPRPPVRVVYGCLSPGRGRGDPATGPG